MRKITPSVWGEPMWRTMHIVALGYPHNPSPDIRQAYKTFYDSLRVVIPCVTCRDGYIQIADESPVDAALGNTEDLFHWTVHVHNKVNEKLGKLPMTPEYVRTTYIFGTSPEKIDPAVERATWTVVATYGGALVAIAVTAWLVYLLFRPAPTR